MPHVIVKLVPGKSEALKHQLTDEIVRSVVSVLGVDQDLVSVAFEEIQPADWADLYRDQIQAHPALLYKPPGYAL